MVSDIFWIRVGCNRCYIYEKNNTRIVLSKISFMDKGLCGTGREERAEDESTLVF